MIDGVLAAILTISASCAYSTIPTILMTTVPSFSVRFYILGMVLGYAKTTIANPGEFTYVRINMKI